MLTSLRIRNFKRFADAEIPLGKAVVLIGPNNSGKTTALQGLALWDLGLRSWLAKRGDKASPEKRPGVAVNRRDLISIPIPSAKLLWHHLHVRDAQKVNNARTTRNIHIDVIVTGVTADKSWECGFEFDYTNEESFVCRPIRLRGYEEVQVSKAKFTQIPTEVSETQVSYLPPMSGLADREFIKQPGEIGFLIGQGQTAQVLRNMCLQVFNKPDRSAWDGIVAKIRDLFGATLLDPNYVSDRSEIIMEYEEEGARLDLSSAGRGLQQTLLLLAHLRANPKTVLLLDEPDAHLEILRQRQIFQLLTEVAEEQASQIIAASHSEVVLNEAGSRASVVAFVGKPHRLNADDRGSQVLKALSDIGWEDYYQAEEKGWVLYLEDASDLAILQAFAKTLEHEKAIQALQRAFIHYVATNLPQKAREHFYGLREAKTDLVGIAIFDRLDKQLQQGTPLEELMWGRREIENYFCTEDVLIEYARHDQPDDLFGKAEANKREQAMRESIREVAQALTTLGKPDPWSSDIKATDDFLDPLFKKFFQKMGLPLAFRKHDYHRLAPFIPKNKIDSEIGDKLDAIARVAGKAKPRRN
ncbi:MAG: AAA family ATPase [Planctomycetota bacterium]